MTRPEF